MLSCLSTHPTEARTIENQRNGKEIRIPCLTLGPPIADFSVPGMNCARSFPHLPCHLLVFFTEQMMLQSRRRFWMKHNLCRHTVPTSSLTRCSSMHGSCKTPLWNATPPFGNGLVTANTPDHLPVKEAKMQQLDKQFFRLIFGTMRLFFRNYLKIIEFFANVLIIAVPRRLV